MLMQNTTHIHSQTIFRVLGPILICALFTVLLSGCEQPASSPETVPVLEQPSPEKPQEPDVMSSSAKPLSPRPEDAPKKMDDTKPAEPLQVPPVAPSSATIPTSPKEQPSAYKDGTYTAAGAYASPGGPESIDVTLTLKGGIVTSASVVGHATLGKSKGYQDLFAQGFTELVVGKSIDSVSLSVVNGSSLTGRGFNDAVAKMKAQAKS